jgi:2-polyprenyl-3-methyl-5-hydroxy-6-metoxy-1,4-benzoquinol methylase
MQVRLHFFPEFAHPMSGGYKVLPEIYDRWQQSYGKDFSTLILPKLLRTIKKYGIRPPALLDLACGTGTLAIMMKRKGWDVLGIDASEAMIEVATRKTKSVRPPIAFLRQDMRSFASPRKVGLVTCMFDAINHLTSHTDVLRCFRGVNAVLETGGYFVFDVNNELCYKTVWRQTDVIHEPDFTIILQNSFDAGKRRAESDVTLFLRNGTLFRKKTEIVRERFYPRDEIRDLLDRADFTVMECDDFNFTPDPMVGEVKTWWVARKKDSAP